MRNNDLRAALEDIYERRGELSPQVVLEEARPSGSPLHLLVFDRNRKDAAEAWYLHRARELIQKVKIRYVTPDGSEQDVRAFVAVRNDGAVSAYKPASEIASDPFLTAMALRQMEHDWRALLRRYQRFEAFAEMVRRDLGEAA